MTKTAKVINIADAKAKHKTANFYLHRNLRTITEETVKGIATFSPSLITEFHVGVATSDYHFRQETQDNLIADNLLVHFNAHKRYSIVPEVIPEDIIVVPLGLLINLYVITNVNLDIALTYQFPKGEEMQYLHTDTKTVYDMVILKNNYIERMVEEKGISNKECQFYLASQLFYLRTNAVEDFTLTFVWTVAGELASPETNGIQRYFLGMDDEGHEYEGNKAKFQQIEPDELYKILRHKLTISVVFFTLKEFMDATEKWILKDKEKVTTDDTYLYANMILDKYKYIMNSGS